jgi:hypothetical protein
MMTQHMKRIVLTLAALAGLAACKDHGPPAKHGPAYTPLVANQLKGLAGECEIRDQQAKQLLLCKGRQAIVNIHLDAKRNLISLDIGVWAPLFDEAEQLIRLAVQGIVPANAVKAMSERLRSTKSEPIVIDGVRVDAYHTQTANENPRYKATFAW